MFAAQKAEMSFGLSLFRYVLPILWENLWRVHWFALTVRDGFTHRPNRPWPRSPRFWGPRATLPMTTLY